MSKSKTPERNFAINRDMVVAASALFISLCALVVSIMQVQIESQQLKASVWPRLGLMLNSNSLPPYQFHWEVINKGVGPALIHKMELSHKGTTYANMKELLYALAPDSLRQLPAWESVGYGVFFPNDIMQEDEHFNVVKFPQDRALTQWIIPTQLELMKDPHFVFRITYGDVYGNCWLLDKYQAVEIGTCE